MSERGVWFLVLGLAVGALLLMVLGNRILAILCLVAAGVLDECIEGPGDE
jgi:hypothetical protein